MELSGFLRRATTGVSSMPTACVQWKIERRSDLPCLARTGSICAWSPTSTTLEFGIGRDRLHRAGNDGAGGVVAAHRVQGDPHRLLLLFRRHDFATLVIAAVGADTVRQHRLIALRAVLDLHRLNVLMAPPIALAGVRGPSLWYGHDSIPVLSPWGQEALC